MWVIIWTFIYLYIYIYVYNLCQSFQAVALVERNIVPQGLPLVDPTTVAKSSQQDLMTLVAEIEKVRENNLENIHGY